MKKALLIFAMGALFSMSASAQWFDFSNNNKRLNVGLHVGPTGIGTDFSQFGWGGSLDVYGVYIDYIGAGPMYKYDNHVNVGPTAMMPDSTVSTINIGYQIPILPWLRIMPVIGHCHTTHGYTDFSTVNVEVTGSSESTSAQMYHDYVKEGAARHYWNYGGGIIVTPVKWVNIYGIYTIRSIYGGISFNLGALSELRTGKE